MFITTIIIVLLTFACVELKKSYIIVKRFLDKCLYIYDLTFVCFTNICVLC